MKFKKIPQIDFQKMDGLIPAIIQDKKSLEVLMLGYMNREAVSNSLRDGYVWFWSRSRQCLWLKGEKSKNYLLIQQLEIDCDKDALLVQVEQATSKTPICHTGSERCFEKIEIP